MIPRKLTSIRATHKYVNGTPIIHKRKRINSRFPPPIRNAGSVGWSLSALVCCRWGGRNLVLICGGAPPNVVKENPGPECDMWTRVPPMEPCPCWPPWKNMLNGSCPPKNARKTSSASCAWKGCMPLLPPPELEFPARPACPNRSYCFLFVSSDRIEYAYPQKIWVNAIWTQFQVAWPLLFSWIALLPSLYCLDFYLEWTCQLQYRRKASCMRAITDLDDISQQAYGKHVWFRRQLRSSGHQVRDNNTHLSSLRDRW